MGIKDTNNHVKFGKTIRLGRNPDLDNAVTGQVEIGSLRDTGTLFERWDGTQWVALDSSVQNDNSVIYVKGNETTDGSVRLIPGVDPLNVRLRARVSGVWNNTGIEVSGSTIHIDHDLRLGSAGDWLRLTDADDSLQALLPHFEYSDANGSVPYPNAPHLSPLRIKEILQPDDSVETTTILHQWIAPPSTDQLLIKTVWLRTGATAATEPVTVEFWKGTDDTGILFFSQNYPTSTFPANTDIELSLIGLADVFEGDVIYHEIRSTAAFTLKGNASLVPWHGHSDYLVVEEDIMTLQSGLPQILTSESGQVVTDEAGDIIYE